MLKKPISLTYTMLADPRYEILDPVEVDDQVYQRIDDAAQATFAQLNGLEFIPPANGKASLPAKVVITTDAISERDKEYIVRHASYPELFFDSMPLRFSAVWPDPESVARECRTTGRKHNRDVVSRVCGSALEDVARKLSIAVSLYCPGVTTSFYAYRYPFDKLLDANTACYGRLDVAAGLLAMNNLPLTPTGSIEDFLHWTKNIEGFWTGLPTTNLGRAMTLISHAHHHEFEMYGFEDFVWLMAAVETIYCDTNAALGEKLRKRIGIVLSPYSDVFTRRKINSLYEFRSKFFHGGISIPNKFGDDPFDRDYDYLFEFRRNFDFLSSILIKTLHVAFERRRLSMDFVDSLV